MCDSVEELAIDLSEGVEILYERFRERHINGSRIKHRSTGNETNLENESNKVERVIIKHDSTTVTDNFDDTSYHHEAHEKLGPPSNAEIDVNDHGKGV